MRKNSSGTGTHAGSGRRTRTCLAALTVSAAVGVLPAVVTPSARAAAPEDLSARIAGDCSQHRLQLLLTNNSDDEQTFTVEGPVGSSETTRKVAAGGNTELHWTMAEGSAYRVRTTAPGGFQETRSGTLNCGLRSGTPQMNTTELFSTRTEFKGLLGADGREYDGTVKSVRIPAMAVTGDGTVLAVTDARVDGSADLPNNIQAALRRSTDNGATWSEPEIVHHAETIKEGTGDTSLVVDRETNRVFLFFNYGPEGTGFFNRDSDSNSADDPNTLHAQYISSDDNGKSWSDPVELNPQIKGASWKNLFLSSGHGIQTSEGRLVQPVVFRDDKGTHATNIVSDDHGRTWKAGATAGSDVNESKAVERGSGKLVQNMRHNSAKARQYAESTDGTAPFSEMSASALADPGVNADEIAHLRPVAGKPGLTKSLLFSNPASTSARDDLTVRTSSDDGASWSDGALIKPGAAGYSTMAVLEDGSVANLYEVGGTGGIFFSRFTTDWLK